MPLMAVLGAAIGLWCAQAALVYARLLDDGAHVDAASLLNALRLACRPRSMAISADGCTGVPPALKLLTAATLAAVFVALVARYG